ISTGLPSGPFISRTTFSSASSSKDPHWRASLEPSSKRFRDSWRDTLPCSICRTISSSRWRLSSKVIFCCSITASFGAEHLGLQEPVGLLPPELEPFGLGLVEPGQEAGDPLPQLSLVGNCQLGGVGGGGGPKVGHKVRDGHVRLMAHGGDHGDLG